MNKSQFAGLEKMDKELRNFYKSYIHRKAADISFGLKLRAEKERLTPHGNFTRWVNSRYGKSLSITKARKHLRMARRFLSSREGSIYFALTPGQLLHAVHTEDALDRAILAYVKRQLLMKVKQLD